ncbi:MAG TPA: RluA family pseudouridine synthase [Bacillota bacterium]|nr:RluA family pseudouridine synthase [Bacillota bacterium]
MDKSTHGSQQNPRNSWLSHVITEQETGQTLQAIITGPMGCSRRMIQKLTRSKGILLNGRTAFLKKPVKTGDVVKVRIQDFSDGQVNRKPEQGITPQFMLLDIIFEDEDLLIINKPAGLKVHPTQAGESSTLSNGVAYLLAEKGLSPVVRPVHRLDTNTSGVIAFTKNQFSHHQLDIQLKNREMKREYLAVVEGTMDEWFPQNQVLVIDKPIGRQKGHPTRRVVRPDGEVALTYVHLVGFLKNATLVRVSLETGRTHQIRVHLSHLGHPVAGDSLYGSRGAAGIRRQALHAARLALVHPRSNEPCIFEAPMPQDMADLVKGLTSQI